MGIWRLRGEFFQDIDDGLCLRAGIAAALDVLDDGLPVEFDGYHHSSLKELDERDDQSRLRGHEKHELPSLLIDFFCDVFLSGEA
jgi:hypothetical protein